MDSASPIPPLGRPGWARSLEIARDVRRLSERQHGVVTRRQLLAAGASAVWVAWHVRSGDLVPIERSAYRYRPCDVGDGFSTLAMAACLARGPHAVLSHGSAARLYEFELPKWPEKRIEVTVPPGRDATSTDRVRVHRSRSLLTKDRAHFGPLPVTTVARTVLDLAATLERAAVERLVDDALLRDKTTVGLLSAVVDRSARRGLTRIGLVRDAVGAWQDGAVDSHAEARVLRALLAAGFPSPRRQFVVVDGAGFVARVDFAWPEYLLIVEVDGFEAHAGPRQLVADRQRWNRLRALGYLVVPTTAREACSGNVALFKVLSDRFAEGPRSGAGGVTARRR